MNIKRSWHVRLVNGIQFESTMTDSSIETTDQLLATFQRKGTEILVPYTQGQTLPQYLQRLVIRDASGRFMIEADTIQRIWCIDQPYDDRPVKHLKLSDTISVDTTEGN